MVRFVLTRSILMIDGYLNAKSNLIHVPFPISGFVPDFTSLPHIDSGFG